MAREASEAGQEQGDNEDKKKPSINGKPPNESAHGEDDGSEEEEEEEEEEEPRLKYESLTKYLKPIYSGGDATSTFLVAGDKMVKVHGNVVNSSNDILLDHWHTQWQRSKCYTGSFFSPR